MQRNTSNLSLLVIVGIIFLDGLVWYQIFRGWPTELKLHFLDVGQGDSALMQLGDVKILTDAGPNSKVIKSLEKLEGVRKYVDLAIISHPQLDHFNGFNYLLDRYSFGAFILNGRESQAPEWKELMKKISDNKIPVIRLGAGDSIKYLDNKLAILSPGRDLLQSGELNDTSLVVRFETPKLKVIMTGDIGASAEKFLLRNYPTTSLVADILKVPHHGSKYSLGKDFLGAVQPKVAVIEVGQNRYGHPGVETLKRLGNLGVKVFRTDLDGNVSSLQDGDRVKFFKDL